MRSRSSGPAITESISAASATVRVIGPLWMVWSLLDTGHCGTRPYDGLRPNTPQNAEGIRIEPAPSEPWCKGPSPAAAAAPAPALEPPVVIAGFHGLRVMPVTGLSPIPFQPNSGVVVLPRNHAAGRGARTKAASTSGTRSAKMSEPPIVRMPVA